MKLPYKSIIFSTLLFMGACSPPEGDTDLAGLKQKKKELLAQQKEIKVELDSLNAQIARMDTSLLQTKSLVTTIEMENKAFKHYFDVQGTVDAKNNIMINSENGGVVRRFAVKEGQRVKRGQLIAIIDNEVMDANVEELTSALALATTAYERQKRLWEQKIGTEMQYLQAKSNKESLEARLRAIKTQSGKANITAPFSGVIDQIFASEGELTGPQVPLVRLVNLDETKVVADVPENHLNSVRAGMPVDVYFDLMEESVECNVSSVGAYINPANRTFRLYVELPKDDKFKPNLYAKIRICDLEVPEAMVLPSNLIQQDRSGNDFVYVLKENAAQKTVIRVGATEGGMSWIQEGIEVGDVVVDRGSRSIRDGEIVRVEEAQA